jgi:hypothetical protein
LAAGDGGRDAGAGGRASAEGGAGASAAGAGDAGHVAAGGGGAGGAPSLCSNDALWFCDGFEGAEIDQSTWKAMQSMPSLDSAHVARGAKSLHMHTTATGASGLTITKFFSTAMGHYYGRLFVYFDALPTKPQWAHWTIVGANPKQGETISGENRVGGQFDGSINRWGVGTDQGPTGDWTNLDDDPTGHAQNVAGGRWYCVEWLHDWDQDVSKLFIDGVEHPSLDTTADVKHQGNANVKYEIPVLGSVWVGFWNYDQHQTVVPSQFDVWIDEVAFDDERVGCDR